MYNNRNHNPHHLSYSAVTSYHSNSNDSYLNNQYSPKDQIEKINTIHRTSLKP